MLDTLPMQDFTNALGWTLIHFLWQGVAIVGAYWLLTRLLRAEQAQARYWAGLAAYLASAVAPVITFTWQFGNAGSEVVTRNLSLPAMSVVNGYPVSAGAFLREALEPALPVVVVLWAIGVTVLSSRTFIGWMGARRMTRVGAEPIGAELQAVTVQLATKLGIRRGVRVLRSTLVRVPTVIGWIKPVVLMPASVITRLPASQLEMIIAHELAHVRRNDYLVNLLQLVVETLFFYHPGIRWLSRQVRAEREHCCDDLVVAQCGRPVQYARALASLEALREVPAAPALGATGGDLFYRVSRIVGRDRPRNSSGHVQIALALSVALTATVGARQGMEMGVQLPIPGTVSQQAPEMIAMDRQRPGVTLGLGLRRHDAAQREAESARLAEERAAASQHVEQAANQVALEAATRNSTAIQTLENAEDSGPMGSALNIDWTPSKPIIIDTRPLLLASTEAAPLPDAPELESVLGEVDEASAVTAVPVRREAPDYPFLAYRDGLEGHVKLQFNVDRRGRVRNPRVVEANPARVFDAAALKALKKWTFDVDEGHDPELRLYQTFEFAVHDTARTPQRKARRCNRTGSNICGSHYSEEHVETFGADD